MGNVGFALPINTEKQSKDWLENQWIPLTDLKHSWVQLTESKRNPHAWHWYALILENGKQTGSPPTPWLKKNVPPTPFLGKQAKLRSQAPSYSFSFVSVFSQLQAAFLRWRARPSLLWLIRVVKWIWRTQHAHRQCQHLKCRLLNLPMQWPLHRSSSCCSASSGCTAQTPHSGASA